MSALNATFLHSITGEDSQLLAGAVGLTTVLATAAAYYALSSNDGKHEFPKLGGIHLFHTWNFLRRPHDFFSSQLRKHSGRSFTFDALHHKVIVLTGEDGRHAFYSNPHLDLGEGYSMLMGVGPRLSDVDKSAGLIEEEKDHKFRQLLNQIFNKTRMEDVVHTFLRVIISKADRWGNDGKGCGINPFDEFHVLMFDMTAHVHTCDDLARNEADLARIKRLFEDVQAGATPVALLLPWFPSPSRKKVKASTTELFTTIHRYVERRKDSEPSNDAIDVMIANGEETIGITKFIVGALLAGVSGTTIIVSWLLVYLAINPEWKEKCKKEIHEFLSRHLDDPFSSATLHEKLNALPLSAWDDKFPFLDACTREAHRISITGHNLRRNIHEDFKIGEQVVRKGDFLAYSQGDTHLNPEYYPEPYKYDPGRWLRPDPVPDTTYPFLGWGIGRHPCAGMKLGRLMMKVFLITFLARYDYELVDEDGVFPDPLPVPNRNDSLRAFPCGAKYYFNLKRVME